MNEEVLKQPQTRTLRDHAVEVLRDAIVSGRLKPGQRLFEGEIANQLGLSRSPVREALRQLEKEGLVQTIPNKGTMVVQFTRDDVIQIYGIRRALEQLAVEWAIPLLSKSDLESLRRIVHQMAEVGTEALPERAERVLALDMEFHRIIWRATRARRLVDLLEGFLNHIRMLMAISGRAKTEAGAQSMVQEHAALVECLEAGQVERAKALMAAHIDAAQARILSRLDLEEPREQVIQP